MPRSWSALLDVAFMFSLVAGETSIGLSSVEGVPVESFVEFEELEEVSLDDERNNAVEGLEDGYQEELNQRKIVHADEDETDLIDEAEDTSVSDDEMMKMMIDHGDPDDDDDDDDDYSELDDEDDEDGISQLEHTVKEDIDDGGNDDEPHRVASCGECSGGCFAKSRCHRKRPDNGTPISRHTCESRGGRWCGRADSMRGSALLALAEQQERDEETIANLPDYLEEETTHEERLS